MPSELVSVIPSCVDVHVSVILSCLDRNVTAVVDLTDSDVEDSDILSIV
jgi:hypothetical protein